MRRRRSQLTAGARAGAFGAFMAHFACHADVRKNTVLRDIRTDTGQTGGGKRPARPASFLRSSWQNRPALGLLSIPRLSAGRRAPGL